MAGDHVAHLAMTGEGELETGAEAVERRAAGTDHAHCVDDVANAERFVGVLACFEGDVVAEPLRLLVGVGVAADVDEQRGVVDRCPLGLVEAEQLTESKPDQALTQDVFHRLPEAEVDPQRQRRDEFGQPNRCDPRRGSPRTERTSEVLTPKSEASSEDEANASCA